MDIRKLKERIAALVAKAKDVAASEAEAMEALAMAAKLAEKYGVNLSDFEGDNEPGVDRRDFASNGDKSYLHEVDSMLGTALANFCDVKIWRTGATVTFMGMEADIELAVFLRERLKATMEFEYKLYRDWDHVGKVTKGVRASFMRGFAGRVSDRMKEVKAKTAHYNRDSHALIVRKGDLIERKMTEQGINLGKGRAARQTAYNPAAAAAGGMAGGRADIGRGMSNNAGLLR